jgi:hypothetical protein
MSNSEPGAFRVGREFPRAFLPIESLGVLELDGSSLSTCCLMMVSVSLGQTCPMFFCFENVVLIARTWCQLPERDFSCWNVVSVGRPQFQLGVVLRAGMWSCLLEPFYNCWNSNVPVPPDNIAVSIRASSFRVWKGGARRVGREHPQASAFIAKSKAKATKSGCPTLRLELLELDGCFREAIRVSLFRVAKRGARRVGRERPQAFAFIVKSTANAMNSGNYVQL